MRRREGKIEGQAPEREHGEEAEGFTRGLRIAVRALVAEDEEEDDEGVEGDEGAVGEEDSGWEEPGGKEARGVLGGDGVVVGVCEEFGPDAHCC